MKSKSLKSFDDMVGKTVASHKSSYGGYACLHFSDGTNVVLASDYSTPNSPVIVIDPTDDTVDEDELVELGVLSEDEYAIILSQYKIREQARKDASERDTYERLKRKFEAA